MRGPIAGATPLSQLFIYINNCLQFWVRVPQMVYAFCKKEGLLQYALQRVFYSIRLSPSIWVTARNFFNPATGGKPYGVEDPLQRVLQQPLFVTNSIHHPWDSNLRPFCQRLEFHTHTDLHWSPIPGEKNGECLKWNRDWVLK